MSTDQDVIFTATARNIAQIINGRVSTDTDGNPTIYAEDYAAAAVDVLREARIPSGVDRAAAWDAAVAMLHPAVRAAIIAFNQDAIFPGEDFPEPADGEGARVAREEAAWEAQIKAAPMPAPALTEWCRAAEEAAWEAQIKAAPMPAPVPAPAPAPSPAPSAWAQRAPVGSVWRFADDGLHAPAGAMGLSVLSSNPHGIFGVVREHVAIAAYGEPFVTADCVLLAFPSGPGVVMSVSALLWAAKRVDA
jgi:hypothetical protein